MNLYLLAAVAIVLAFLFFFGAYFTQGKKAERVFQILFLVFFALGLLLFLVWGFTRTALSRRV